MMGAGKPLRISTSVALASTADRSPRRKARPGTRSSRASTRHSRTSPSCGSPSFRMADPSSDCPLGSLHQRVDGPRLPPPERREDHSAAR